ncbi:MAG: 3-dehydroquinate synthase, partial [Fimbriimonadaceae bacterium]
YELLHGEAIAIGMVLEAELGESLGLTQPGTREIVQDRLAAAGLPTHHKGSDVAELLRLMKADKKATASGISFSLLTHVGGCKLVTGVAEDSIMAVLNQQ